MNSYVTKEECEAHLAERLEAMSNHSNVDGVGLAVDLVHALSRRLRGKAAEVPFEQILNRVSGIIESFVIVTEEHVNMQMEGFFDGLDVAKNDAVDNSGNGRPSTDADGEGTDRDT